MLTSIMSNIKRQRTNIPTMILTPRRNAIVIMMKAGNGFGHINETNGFVQIRAGVNQNAITTIDTIAPDLVEADMTTTKAEGTKVNVAIGDETVVIHKDDPPNTTNIVGVITRNITMIAITIEGNHPPAIAVMMIANDAVADQDDLLEQAPHIPSPRAAARVEGAPGTPNVGSMITKTGTIEMTNITAVSNHHVVRHEEDAALAAIVQAHRTL